MSQSAVLTQGTLLKRGDGGSPEVFTAVEAVTTINGPDSAKGEIETTDLASVAKEFKGALPDPGRITAEMEYIPGNSGHAAIRADFYDLTSPVRNWQLVFVNGKRWDFAAYVASLPLNVQPDNVLRASVVLRLSGNILEV